MTWNIEYTNEFGEWWQSLSESAQETVEASVNLLAERGMALRYPYSSGINGSRHPHMRELRIQHQGKPVRIFYAFDPRRSAILLIGGDKTGDDRFYEEYIPLADRLYDEHLKELEEEGLL